MLCLQFHLVALLLNKPANIGHCQQTLLRFFFILHPNGLIFRNILAVWLWYAMLICIILPTFHFKTMKHWQEGLLPVNSSIFIMFMSARALSPLNTSSKRIESSKTPRDSKWWTGNIYN